jgi:hydrogenase maturation protein HypF
MTAIASSKSSVAIRICVAGCVQGSGVRPAVSRLASSLDLTGRVRNTLAGLEIEVEGTTTSISTFQERLPSLLPSASVIKTIDNIDVTHPQQTLVTSDVGFAIEQDDATGPLTTQVPPDVVVCVDCSAETRDKDDRRYRYPLTTCATCGPRYSLVKSMPFDRVRTTMDSFPLCNDCQAEYTSPANRRFHAQTIGCAKCGPQVWLADEDGRRTESGPAAVSATSRLLLAGKIVALRGVGGYQLLCNATSQEAVERLRSRKDRPAKPFAVLVASLEAARRHANIDEIEADALTDLSNPIVLLRARSSNIVDLVHPNLSKLGLMLPATPLHAMLCEQADIPLACTSANREGEPLEYDVHAAETRLAGIADAWLHHDRPIVRPIDDSVVQVIAGRRVILRLGRGLAPLSLALPDATPRLAVGGHMKSAVAWHNGSQAVLGPHIGNLDTIATRERFDQHVTDMGSLYRFAPESVVHDLHPDYFTTRFACELDIKSAAIQHHFAHIVAGMLEHEILDRKVLGVSWDGTGLGDDGAIWGGEFLVVENGETYTRVAHLRPFPLLGGNITIRQPWRVAVSLLNESFANDNTWLEQATSIWSRQPVAALQQMHRGRTSSTLSTSAGRLFDAVAAIILGLDVAEYEGQAAMMLEAVASSESDGIYSLSFEKEELDWREMLIAIWKDQLAGVCPAVISARFHRTLASGIVAVADEYSELPIVLAGGVFQNRLLTELVVELLDDHERIKLPGLIPPNDGGLAAGQLAISVMREHSADAQLR